MSSKGAKVTTTVRAALASGSVDDFRAAGRAAFEAAIGHDEWGAPPMRPQVAEAYASLAGRAYARDPRATLLHVLLGQLPLPTDRHPTYMHSSVAHALPHVLAKANNVTDMPRPAKSLELLTNQFVFIEGIVRPHLGLLCAWSAIALGDWVAPESIYVDDRREGRIRSVGSMHDLSSGYLSRLKGAGFEFESSALRDFWRGLGDRGRGDELIPGVDRLRNAIAHLDVEVADDGSVRYDFNKQTRKYARALSWERLWGLHEESIRTVIVLRGVVRFAMELVNEAPKEVWERQAGDP